MEAFSKSVCVQKNKQNYKKMLRSTRRFFRGYFDPEPVAGHNFGFTPARIGGTPRVQPCYQDLTYQQPERPLRAEKPLKNLPPVLYTKSDQVMEIHMALVKSRTKNQIRNAMNQLNLAVRNADVYIKDVILKDKVGARPHIHDMVFAPGGFNQKQHILANLPTHQIVPFLSLVSYDYEEGRIDFHQATEVVHAFADSTVGHSKMVQREIYNQYVRVCALEQNAEKAFSAVREMKAKGIRRNYVTYAPIYRLARQKMDDDLHIAVTDLASDVEGGLVKKFFLIDVPRVFSVVTVFVRFFWRQIVTLMLVAGGLLSAFVMLWVGLT